MKIKLHNYNQWKKWAADDSFYSDFEKYAKWMKRLPLTKRGSRAYKLRQDLAVIFTRREDAIAFKLTFGL